MIACSVVLWAAMFTCGLVPLDGARLAVLADRDSAFAAALAHELAPVSVH